MNKKLVRCMGYYGGNFMLDLLRRAESARLWEEVSCAKAPDVEVSAQGLDEVKKVLTDREFARNFMKGFDSAGDLYDVGVVWSALGGILEELATGERHREFQELEDFAFLLYEAGEVIQAFALELNDDDPRTEAYVDAFVDLMVAGDDTKLGMLGKEEWE